MVGHDPRARLRVAWNRRSIARVVQPADCACRRADARLNVRGKPQIMTAPAPSVTTVPPAWLGSLMRRLPAGFRGKARVARTILGDTAGYGSFLVQTRSNLRFVVPSLADSIGFHLYIDGIYEPAEIAWVLARLEPGDVFVDVGANIGVFTVMAAKRVGPTGRVIAFEPSPSVIRYLEENVRLNELTNVTVCPLALDESAADA